MSALATLFYSDRKKGPQPRNEASNFKIRFSIAVMTDVELQTVLDSTGCAERSGTYVSRKDKFEGTKKRRNGTSVVKEKGRTSVKNSNPKCHESTIVQSHKASTHLLLSCISMHVVEILSYNR